MGVPCYSNANKEELCKAIEYCGFNKVEFFDLAELPYNKDDKNVDRLDLMMEDMNMHIEVHFENYGKDDIQPDLMMVDMNMHK